MARQQGAHDARPYLISKLVRLLMLFALFPISALAGCGGRVVVSEEELDSDDPSQEAGTSIGGKSPRCPVVSVSRATASRRAHSASLVPSTRRTSARPASPRPSSVA